MAKLIGLPKTKEGYRVELEAFSGPIELLLHLVKTQEIDIYDIPIAQVTNQYLEYLTLMEELDLDVAGEFLVMAANLIYIKSKTLLPEEPVGIEEEEEDPRAELVEALLEYKRYKGAAGQLEELNLHRQEIFDRGEANPEGFDNDLIETDLFGLISAFRQVLTEIGQEPFKEISRSPVTVKEKIKEILNFIEGKGSFIFGEIFRNVRSRIEAVATFLALLELMKQRQILVRQNKVFGEIRIFKR